MGTRETLADLFRVDAEDFDDEVELSCRTHDLDTDRLAVTTADVPDAAGLEPGWFGSLSARERDLVRRLWVLDDAPLGITISGPVYQDTPIVHANQTFREITGYSAVDVRGENLRKLQGPDTDPGPVDSLREALDIWEPVTVELWNYRADGTRFRNRVSLVPLYDDAGTIPNWVGLQERVES